MIRRRVSQAFTLIELVIVMVIIGILVLLGGPKFINYARDADVTAMQVDIKTLEDAALYYRINHRDKDKPLDKDQYPVGETSFRLTEGQGEFLDRYRELVEYNLKEAGFENQVIDGIIDENSEHFMHFYRLDKEKLGDQVNTTKNKIEDYVIVTKGPLIGHVFYDKILEDSMGSLYIGLIGMPKDK